jgi:biotin transport system substrate-specific component
MAIEASALGLARHRARPIVMALAGSLVIAVAAQVAIPLPFSPVPITLQTAAVALVGAALGARLGAGAVLAYLVEGAAGLPFFAGGTGGAAILLGPTGGFLVGFILSAFLAGWLVERGWGRGTPRAVLTFLVAGAVVYLVGLPRLAMFVGTERAIPLGLVPFLPGDLIKTAAAAALWTGASRFVRS